MRSRWCWLLCLCVGLAACSCEKKAVPAPKRVLDLSSPKATTKSFLDAAWAGDAEAAKACVVAGHEQEVLTDGFVAFAKASKKLFDAMRDRYGKTITGKSGDKLGMGLDPSVVDSSREEVLGDIAGIALPNLNLALRKVDGKWKIDYASSTKVSPGEVTAANERTLAQAKALDEVASDIRAGKFANYREAQAAVKEKLDALKQK